MRIVCCTCVKEKLTLTIDGEALAHAKAFAKRQKTSLSRIVEEQFKHLGTESFVEKWYGKFKVPPADPKDPRLMYLLHKYVYHRSNYCSTQMS